MLHKLKISLLLTITTTISLQAIIVESDTIVEVKKHLNASQKIVIAYDVDNTLAWPGMELGSDPWFTAMWEQKQAEGLTSEEILEAIIPLYIHVQNHIPLVLIEPLVPQMIQDLQNQGIMMLALTSRNHQIASRTYDQLKDLSIDFSGIYDHEIDLSMDFPAIYKHGIIFSSNNNKGTMLMQFLHHIGFKPDKIIFIDDKLKYVTAVEKAVEAEGIEFVGIRYSRLDEEVKSFNIAKANQQLKEFLAARL